MKHPLKQMSLLCDEKLAALVTPEHINEEYLDILQRVAYIDNTSLEPKNFPEGSEAHAQWTYTGRKKNDKQTLQQSYQEV